MSEKILIFGKNTWPFTNAAREAYAQEGKSVIYVDVLADTAGLDNMLEYSGGTRKVPVIVDQGNVIIGFKGKNWKA